MNLFKKFKKFHIIFKIVIILLIINIIKLKNNFLNSYFWIYILKNYI